MAGGWDALQIPPGLAAGLRFFVFPLLGSLCALAGAGLLFGWRRAGLFFALTLLLAWSAEEIGVRTGLLFGRYVYGDVLGPKLGSVPWVIPFFWFMIVCASHVSSNLIAAGAADARGGWLKNVRLSLLTALLATAYDLGLDPYMAAAEVGAWSWLDGGAYYGVPLHNYGGWLLTAFWIDLFFRRLDGRQPARCATGLVVLGAALPVGVYLVLWLGLLGPGHPLPARLVSLVVPGIPALAAAAMWYRWQRKVKPPGSDRRPQGPPSLTRLTRPGPGPGQRQLP